MTSKINGPKGAPDLVPPRSALYESVIDSAISQFRLWGYQRVDTPAYEHTELFERGLEAGSDIVAKQMYTFEDKGGRSLTLRPDMTAPVVRAILERGLDRGSLPVKLYYVAPIFRHERPQAGRFRQFTQVGVEAVGSAGPEIDADVIQLAAAIYRQIGLPGVKLLINSIGHPACRQLYLPQLQAFLYDHKDELCEDCRRKIDSNPLRTFDCKLSGDREVMARAPVITDSLCAECKEHYESLKDLLVLGGVDFQEEPKLVRGLDYYSRTTFEFISEGLGAQNAVGAGGRYDGLAEQLGGGSLPGIGFGLGVERMVLALEEAGREPSQSLDVFLVSIGPRARLAGFSLTQELRSAGISTDLDYSGKALKAQVKAADRSGAKLVVIIGDKELDLGLYSVKEMRSGEQQSVAAADILGYLKSRL